MNRKLRLGLTILLVIGVIFLSRNQFGRARDDDRQQEQAALGVKELQGNPDDKEPGSVKPPPSKRPHITKPGKYSIGGVCILEIISLSKGISVSTQLLDYTSVPKPPENAGNFLAGVCRVAFFSGQALIPALSAGQGEVNICFASIPNTAPTNYVWSDMDLQWYSQPTGMVEALNCSPAEITGNYVLIGKK